MSPPCQCWYRQTHRCCQMCSCRQALRQRNSAVSSWTINVAGSGCSILIPSARSAFTVCIQSSLGRNPLRVHTPFDKAAMTTARCEMLLSPGTVISRSIRGARFTRNSIDKKKPLVDTQYGMFDKAQAPRQFSTHHQPRTSSRQRYGTRKILSVYGSFTSVPGGNPSTSIYLPGEYGLSTR